MREQGSPSATSAIILSVFGIVLTIFGSGTFETILFLIVLTISALVITYLLNYTRRTSICEEEIEKIEEKLIISERLSKLEAKVFK
ncbi:MAG: hypothetical protein KKC19_02220 [Nanoarchaeota archaeon]|nr:hypothetical protein [Nanoarchaeota archaeon]